MKYWFGGHPVKKYSNRDHLRALTWAKKIMAANFLGGKCTKCGNSDIRVLDFHHNKGQKDECISRILNKTNTQILKEVKKCVLLCRNCHSEIHYDKIKKNKLLFLDMLGDKKCRKCEYSGSSYASLDFHHINKNQKKFGIATIGAYKRLSSYRKNKIRIEIKKCIVLCKNCHIKEHVNKKYFQYLKPLIDYKIKNHIEHKSPETKRIDALRVKGSNYRNRLAKWLRAWKKFKCVNKASKYLGVKNNMLSNNLMQSKTYRQIREKLSKKTSKYIGVSWAKERNRWLACVKINQKNKNLGRFESETDAHRAVIAYKKKVGLL